MTDQQYQTLLDYAGGGVFTLASILGAVLFFGMMANRRFLVVASAIIVTGFSARADGTRTIDDVWHWLDENMGVGGGAPLAVSLVGGGQITIAPGQEIGLIAGQQVSLIPGTTVGLAPGTTVGLAPGTSVGILPGACLRICGIQQEVYDAPLRVRYDDTGDPLTAETFTGSLSPLVLAPHGIDGLDASIGSVKYFGLSKIQDQSLTLPTIHKINVLHMGAVQLPGVSYQNISLDCSSSNWVQGAAIVRGLCLFCLTVCFAFAMQGAIRRGLAN